MAALFNVGNAEAIEALWTSIGVLGLIYAMMNFASAQAAVKYARKLGISDARFVMAKALRVTEMIRFLIQSIVVIIGVMAMTLPPGASTELPFRYRVFGFMIRWGLIVFASLTLIQSFNSWRLRRYFLIGDKSKGR